MPTVETPLGPVQGNQGAACLEFLGIRYAKAPVGPLRFQPPEPVPPWTDPYDATALGPSAPQPQMTSDDAALQMPVEPTDEDCLFLNIYTPATDDGKRPVMFWIHGGGYVAGSGRAYHGGLLARYHDVVVVTINYRMGALGFMHVGHLDPGLGESVNNGILDQIAALEWTRDNIRAFGGDPENVMIFGESAGGTSTAMLLGCPRAEGLFHKACVHSPHVDLIPVGDGHVAFTNRCIERLGGDPESNGLATLMGASTAELVALSDPDPAVAPEPNLAFRRPSNVSFSPAIDGTLIPRPVADTVRQRGAANVPFLGGGCRHEGTLFAAIVGGECSEDEAKALFDREGVNGTRAMAVYERFAPGSTPREKLVYALTDTMFRNSMVRILDAAAESGATCWSWMCTYESDAFGGALRATHAIELPFFWEFAAQGLRAFAGSKAPDDLGPAMRAYWANFARTGTPFAEGEPDWPAYTVPERPVLTLDAERRIAYDLDSEVRRFWFA
ncbi:MAG: carboxylesterase family protein [Gammaproteobacteria bacterium]|nr:carboxylesterase family protein [Gammaproteobacteria bacterium]